MKIKLCGIEIEIDEEDFEKIEQYNWHYDGKAFRTSISLQSLLIGSAKDLCADHKDRNPFNFKKENLRHATSYENRRNVGKKNIKNASSKYKGVALQNINGYKYWRAQIDANHIRYNLGYFNTEKEAAEAYNRAAIKYHGKFAYLNNIID